MKRFIDIVLSLTVLLAFLPVIAATAILVRRHFGSPVLFRQQRPGFHGDPFNIIKFRSMLDSKGPGVDSRTDAERLTRFGQGLRATSFDELPELWNVLVGNMSLVGPRPLLMEYMPLYSQEQARRHEVRPGITGWAQVNGRNSLSWEEKFALDVWYVDNHSIWLDVKIMFLTIVHVFRRDGISAVGEATMPRFTGSKVTDKI